MDEIEFDKFIDAAPEIVHYFIINELGGIIWRLNHDMADGRIEQKDWHRLDKEIAQMREQQIKVIVKLWKFGLVAPFKDDGKTPSEDYWKWFRWWDTYVRALPTSAISEIDGILEQKKSVDHFRPTGNWGNAISPSSIEQRINRVMNSD